MDLEKEFKKIKAILYKWFKKDKGEWFPDEENEGHQKYRIDRYIQRKLKNTDPDEGIYYLASYFEKMALWKIYQSEYALLHNENEKQFYQELSEFMEYSYMAIALEKNTQAFLGFDSVVFPLAVSVLGKRERYYVEIAEAIINSINIFDENKSKQDDGCISRGGIDLNPAMWFILDMYCLAYDRSYDKSHADLPENYTPYDDVLEHWATADLSKVDQLVYLMCETHIMKAVKKSESFTQEFSSYEYQLFPFEIQVWLTFREMKGLENPTQYSHYFMQEPLSQVFPVEKSLSFPEIKDLEKLLTLHHKHYPDGEALEILNNYKADRENA